ncbi:hypothetical protein CYMTET_40833 [Cymbomonas tetramitiformis]|uniref:Uncharacterized protein n=1 Tax=Cymbomonas tetramitiformis TaxID=36881 RepID=A0AAE0C8M8_9CHLO|nr:hypothetical protein CYMTET_40833 [Cymbomonas tetramitiformis]
MSSGENVYAPPAEVSESEAATQPLLDASLEDADESLLLDDDVQINLTRPPPPEPLPPPVLQETLQSRPSEPVPQLSQSAGYVQGIMHLPDLPDAVTQFQKSRPLLKLWLILSIITVVNSLFFWPGLIIGIVGITGASLHVCECCKSHGSIAPYVNASKIMAIIAAAMDTLVIFLLLLQLALGCSKRGEKLDEEEDLEGDMEDEKEGGEKECSAVFIVLLILFAWFSMHAFISVKVGVKCHLTNKLFNPITSGVMVL